MISLDTKFTLKVGSIILSTILFFGGLFYFKAQLSDDRIEKVEQIKAEKKEVFLDYLKKNDCWLYDYQKHTIPNRKSISFYRCLANNKDMQGETYHAERDLKNIKNKMSDEEFIEKAIRVQYPTEIKRLCNIDRAKFLFCQKG